MILPFPWRPLAALLLALAAQTFLEPPAHGLAALVLYLLAFALALWSFQRREWTLPAPPPSTSTPRHLDSPNPALSEVEGSQLLTPTSHPLSPNPRLLPLAASIPLLAAAFYFFGGNQFTWLNLSLWVAGIAFFMRAFWQERQPSLRGGWFSRRHLHLTQVQVSNPRVAEGIASQRALAMTEPQRESAFVRAFREIRVQKSIWVFAAILLVAAFFRFYHLASVPAEPFSDHAEKILDLYDITQGQTHIFFPRNTGREAIQFYWSLLVAAIFQTGLSFQTLKIGTALLGFFTLPFIYLLGKEIANRRAGLLAMLFAGVAYWPNVISRIGLRFPLYPLFVAPTLYFLLRGLRTDNRNDFILSGIFLGLGLHGYSPFRVVPGLVLVTLVLWMIYTGTQVHRYTRNTQHIIPKRSGVDATHNIAILFIATLIIFLPLLRYALEFPDSFWFRAGTRLVAENPVPTFFSNLGNGLLMFNVNDGNTLVNSVVERPALDIVTGALFALGLVLLLRRRSFVDLWLVAAILTLILPSVLSLAYPDENPALNRAGGALVPVFVVVGMTLDGLLTRLEVGLNRAGQAVIVAGVTGLLFAASAAQSYDLVFRQFDQQYQRAVWRTSEMGAVIREFGNSALVWIVPYEHWVDTRLPGVWAGIPNRDFALARQDLASTIQLPGSKLFIFKASPLSAAYDDAATMETLQALYPHGQLTLHESEPWWQSFWVYFVPAQ